MAQYTIKFKFSTARPGRGKGAITGNSGDGELDITVDGPFDPVAAKTDTDLIEGCKQHLQQTNTKLQKMGVIVSFEIWEIVNKNP